MRSVPDRGRPSRQGRTDRGRAFSAVIRAGRGPPRLGPPRSQESSLRTPPASRLSSLQILHTTPGRVDRGTSCTPASAPGDPWPLRGDGVRHRECRRFRRRRLPDRDVARARRWIGSDTRGLPAPSQPTASTSAAAISPAPTRPGRDERGRPGRGARSGQAGRAGHGRPLLDDPIALAPGLHHAVSSFVRARLTAARRAPADVPRTAAASS